MTTATALNPDGPDSARVREVSSLIGRISSDMERVSELIDTSVAAREFQEMLPALVDLEKAMGSKTVIDHTVAHLAGLHHAGNLTGTSRVDLFLAQVFDLSRAEARARVDGAENTSQLASSGTLTPDEHAAFIRFTVDSMAEIYEHNRYARYVAVFQNWLKPAGASFDHLHKQLVAIDERGVQSELEISHLRTNYNMYNEWAVDYANYHNLIIAENQHVVCFAGFGHRYPTLEVFSKSAVAEPWLQDASEVRAMSDMLHACHAATGPDVPCNEEWHHKPVDLDVPMPWRIMIKWRVSTLAGFEGGTKIYVNTLSPENIRDRVTTEMIRLRGEGRIAQDLRIGTECHVEPNSLRYNPLLP